MISEEKLEEKMEEKIKRENRYIGIINSKNLSRFNKLEIPNEQRIKDDDKVKDIIEYQLNYRKENERFNFLGILNIHHLLSDDEYYLVDGQHRYQAIKTLYEDHGYGNINIGVELVDVKTREELKENYRLINKNTPLPEFPESINKNIPEEAAKHYKQKYPKIWSKNERSRRPNIYFNHFQEALGFLTERLNIGTTDELINIIEKHNENITHWDHSKISENIVTKCNDMDFYLGIYNHISDEWGYKWVKDIIYEKTGEQIKGKTKGKKKISQKMKNLLWKSDIGLEKGEILCCCCMNRKISQTNFHAGHIQAEAKGGTIELNNLRAICGPCNIDMNIRHMHNYIKEEYPNNIIFFEEKRFFTPEEWKEYNNPKQSGGFLGMGKLLFGKEKKKKLVLRK
jgi:hypothetical protein